MIKNKEKMADEKSEKMQVRIKKYISDMEKLLDEKKFTIEAIVNLCQYDRHKKRESHKNLTY